MDNFFDELLNQWEMDLKREISLGLKFQKKLDEFVKKTEKYAFGQAKPECFDSNSKKCQECPLRMKLPVN